MDREERIRERAHRIWEEEGRPDGRHDQHWQRACREIDQVSMQGNARTANPGRATAGNMKSAQQSSSSSGLAGADDNGLGVPDRMGVDDMNVGHVSDPDDSRPTTGRSKLVGS